MIHIMVYHNTKKDICKFSLEGHADFSEEGSDIVCSAVTILVFNTINCIEAYTEEAFECEVDEQTGGYLSYRLPDMVGGKQNHDVTLLLKAMLHGLKDIEKKYNRYIKITVREV